MRDCGNCWVHPDDCDVTDCEMEREEKENILGIPLRDYFAGQALAGLLANLERKDCGGGVIQAFAVTSYCIADAMLEERKKEK